MFYRLSAVVVLIVFVSSCSTNRKALKTKVYEKNLDTVEITATRENPYRGSATKYFDLVNTSLEVKFDYHKQYLYGKATITLRPHFYPQKELVLDAKQFDIYEVSLVTGENSREALKFTYDSLQLKIDLDKEYTRDETLKIYIDYTAKPNERKTGGSAAITDDKGLYFINPLGEDTSKPTQIWTQGETESGSCWFPTIDKPNQRCTEEIYITHLKKYVSLSNGSLISTTPVNDSLVTDHWKSELPFAPYLFMMAIGDFAIVRDRWRDIPVDYYVEKEYAPYAKMIFGKTPEMIEYFSQKLGFDYPWAKYDQVIVRDYVSGAMENTSATLHGDFLQRNARELLDETYEDVVSHELFHQWFGDLVTPESWSNIPLNESFATYGEYLWNEYKYGREYADYQQANDYRKYMTEAGEKNVDLIRFHYNDREDVFDAVSYEKGGLVLHYLRKIVGDDAFFKSLNLYLTTNQFKSVEIHNLRLAFEEVTGRDLNWFFNEWFFGAGYPVLDINYSSDNDSVRVAITQKHNLDAALIYTLPFKVAVWYGDKVDTFSGVLNKKSQTFAFKANGRPDLIDFDPAHEVLCSRTDNKTTDNYIFEYKHALYYAEGIETLKKLSEVQEQSEGAKAVLAAALKDTFYHFREFAANKIDLPKDSADNLYSILQNIAKNDVKSSVRREAIDKLDKATEPSRFTALFESGVGDSSYEVAGSALEALDDADSKKAMQVAKQFENDKNGEMVAAVAGVYAKDGDANYQDYFETKLRSLTGYARYSMFYFYANFLTRMEKNMVLKGIKTIEEVGAASEGHYMLAAARNALRRLAKSFEEKKKKVESESANEQNKTAKLQLQEQIAEYDAIISESTDAADRLNAKIDEKKN